MTLADGDDDGINQCLSLAATRFDTKIFYEMMMKMKMMMIFMANVNMYKRSTIWTSAW